MASSTMPALELAFGINSWGGGTNMPCPATGVVGGCITGVSGRAGIGNGTGCVKCMALPICHALGNTSGGGIAGGDGITGGITAGVWFGMVGEGLVGTATGVWFTLAAAQALLLACRQTLSEARVVHAMPKLVAAHLR